MSETNASQSHNQKKGQPAETAQAAAAQSPFQPFQNPFQNAFAGTPFQVPSFTEATEGWKKLMDEQLGRMQAAMQEYAALEQKGFDQANQAVEEMTKLTRATLQYAHDLSGAFRKLALENTRKAAGLETPARKA